jgi:hypothetical protein
LVGRRIAIHAQFVGYWRFRCEQRLGHLARSRDPLAIIRERMA